MAPSDDESSERKPLAVISRNGRGPRLEFPVLEIFSDCICAVHGVKPLTLAMKQAIRAGYYDSALIVDRRGRVYEVCRAVVKSGPSAAGFMNFLIGLASFVIVDLVVADVTSAWGVNSLKERIIADIRQGGTWEDRGDFDGLEARVSDCSSISEIVEVVAG
jgi:hypothetical protein